MSINNYRRQIIAFMIAVAALTPLALGFTGCQSQDKNKITNKVADSAASSSMDIHSYAKPQEAKVKHVSLDLSVLFDKKVIEGQATLTIERTAGAQTVWLDTKDLTIVKVFDKDGVITHTLHAEDSVMGAGLEIPLRAGIDKVNILYSTSPEAEAIQWLSPAQTAGKKHPFLFTQGEAILTRSWIPLQDSPGIRVTYDATIRVPKDLMAVMSADGNPTKKNQDGVYHFQLNEAVAPYLIALAVGDVAFQSVDLRTGVYAEPSMLEKSAFEFADMGKMVDAAEKLYGKYAWGRYDLIVLPPSFPFGGMENPKLTFATPTILAGDRSLTNLVAHELAHSWSGNLVTNATWGDFWLNEGFTVYFERRIMESLQGKDYADMLALLGYQDLNQTIEELGGGQSPMTCLKLDLQGKNPDDGMNDIAYEKGYFLLRMMEDKVGREAFDEWLNSYFSKNAFQSITTESFLEGLQRDLLSKPGAPTLDEVKQWIYQPGLPANCPKPRASRFEAIDSQLQAFEQGKPLAKTTTQAWSTHEWLHFLRGLTGKVNAAQMKVLDETFGLSASQNAEKQFAWYLLAIQTGYAPAKPYMEQFLVRTGRRKFLTPLYEALLHKEGKAAALAIYEKARPNYHFVATNTMDKLLK